MALSKEKKKGCFYTVLGTCQKTFVTGCTCKYICTLAWFHEIFFEWREIQIRNFLLLIFYVKLIFVSLKSQNLLFWLFWHLLILVLVDLCILSELRFGRYEIFRASKMVKITIFETLILPKLISRKIWWMKRKILTFLSSHKILLQKFREINQVRFDLKLVLASFWKRDIFIDKVVLNLGNNFKLNSVE